MPLEMYPVFLKNKEFNEHFKNVEREDFYDLDQVVKFLKNNLEWQVYTELECTDYVMKTGISTANNKTGYYVIVKDSRYQVMEYNLN